MSTMSLVLRIGLADLEQRWEDSPGGEVSISPAGVRCRTVRTTARLTALHRRHGLARRQKPLPAWTPRRAGAAGRQRSATPSSPSLSCCLEPTFGGVRALVGAEGTPRSRSDLGDREDLPDELFAGQQERFERRESRRS